MINKHPPMNRNHNRDPSIEAPRRRGVVNQGSTLVFILGKHQTGCLIFKRETYGISGARNCPAFSLEFNIPLLYNGNYYIGGNNS